ncbi:MAG: peptidylprolyl isomerase [Ktedonobacteraceae bacterium]
MTSQTEQPVKRPVKQKATRSTKPKRYYRQTAHVEARRDGKPLIFGWGKHLSHVEKVKIQRRATWTMAGIFGFLIVGTILAFWININIIVPGKPITSVNGHQIPQSQYRKMVAVKTQLVYNSIYGKQGLVAQANDLTKQDAVQLKAINDLTKQVATLNNEIKALPAGPSKPRTDLENQLQSTKKRLSDAQAAHQKLTGQITNLNQNTIPLAKQSFTQSQVANDSVSWLQNDEIIREWLTTHSPAIQNKVNPTDAQLNKALNDLKATLPATTSYNAFLNQMGISNDDVVSMLTLKVRRDNMQTYLASTVVSPAYQVLSRTITVDTEAAANQILHELKNGGDFGKIASKQSKDTTTASSGGSQGWLARGQYALNQNAAVVENWLFDPARYFYELSPVLKENGSYHIAQIMGIDPSRPIDPSMLQTLQYNALSNWILAQQALPTTTITPVDQNMLLDPLNLPPTSILPAGAPSSGQSVPGSVPAAAP